MSAPLPHITLTYEGGQTGPYNYSAWVDLDGLDRVAGERVFEADGPTALDAVFKLAQILAGELR